MDMSKAFDRLDHNYLLTKLRRLGLMPSAAASWFSSYLLFRKQGRVRYEPRFYLRNTSYKTQCRGYPRAQSWVQSYSPCMWMILWMKLVIVKWNCMLMVISSFSSLRYQIQLTPSQVCSTNSLLINPEKTKFIVVGLAPLTSQLPPVSLTVLGISAVLVSQDQCLNYNIHITKTASTCFHQLVQVNRINTSYTESHLYYLKIV